MGYRTNPLTVPIQTPATPKTFAVIPALVDQAVAPARGADDEELARALHAVIALLDGQRH